MTDRARSPNTIPWPPILYGGLALIAAGLEALAPTELGLPRLVGLVPFLLGLGFDLSAMLAFRRARTNILPHRAAERLVTTGPYAISRNPIYVGNTFIVLGIAILLSSLWMAAAAILAAVLTRHLAILREEEHMSARFGAAWDAYARKVPRWLGPVRT